MAYPYGNHHHLHGRDKREVEDYPPPPRPPPPFYGEFAPPPPPPRPPTSQVYHTPYTDIPDPYPSPPGPAFNNYPPPPQPAGDHHHSHHPHLPHFPSIVHHRSHHKDEEEAVRSSVRMYCKADSNYSLSIRNDKVILARHDPSDPFQHWIKDERHSTRVKDEQGFPSFALINKATGQAMKHSIGATYPVQLIPYNPDVLDESILWTESKDLGDSYRASGWLITFDSMLTLSTETKIMAGFMTAPQLFFGNGKKAIISVGRSFLTELRRVCGLQMICDIYRLLRFPC